jgi:anti-anti-sigma factor
MEAKIKNQDGIAIINITGRLAIEYTQAFRQVCNAKFGQGQVIFNLEGATFVGSTGIQHFIETIKDVHSRNQQGLRVVCGKPEFLRIIQNIEVKDLQIYSNEIAAINSFVPAVPTTNDSNLG